jgi:hypothetical protein
VHCRDCYNRPCATSHDVLHAPFGFALYCALYEVRQWVAPPCAYRNSRKLNSFGCRSPANQTFMSHDLLSICGSKATGSR